MLKSEVKTNIEKGTANHAGVGSTFFFRVMPFNVVFIACPSP